MLISLRGWRAVNRREGHIELGENITMNNEIPQACISTLTPIKFAEMAKRLAELTFAKAPRLGPIQTLSTKQVWEWLTQLEQDKVHTVEGLVELGVTACNAYRDRWQELVIEQVTTSFDKD